MKNQQSRREFLKLSALASSMLITQPIQALSIHDKWNLKRGKKQKVLILGAGMAGMSAALELIKLGHDVAVIEGQTRAGGRVKTLRSPLADGLYADLGAARIPENHEWTMKYIHKYNLKLHPFNPQEGDNVDMLDGKKFRYTRDQPLELKDYPVELTEKERSLGISGVWDASLKPLLNNIGDPKSMDWPPAAIAKYDQNNYVEYLQSQGFSGDYATVINLGYGKDLSLMEMVREDLLNHGAPRNKIVGGNDLLPAKMAEELANTIQYGLKVLNIHQSESDVSVLVSQGNERKTFSADRVICTIPLPVLRKMDFVRSLSREKRMAIYEMSHVYLSRTVMQVKNRYWKDEGFNGFAKTDRPIEIWDPNYESEKKRGLISAYMKDVDSRQMLDWPDKERLDFAASQVNTVFPGLFDHLEGGYTKCWGEDPWALCAHAFTSKGQMTTLLPHLLKPEGRIHLAGEHVSAYHGWMQGAIESGNRVAKEVNSFD